MVTKINKVWHMYAPFWLCFVGARLLCPYYTVVVVIIIIVVVVVVVAVGSHTM